MSTGATVRTVLVHLASGIGNVVLATPLLVALHELGYTVDVRLDADYEDTGDLLRDWTVVRRVDARAIDACPREPLGIDGHEVIVPAVPPFYWRRLAPLYDGVASVLPRPPDGVFYDDEQGYYLHFARLLGYPADRRPFYRLPVAAAEDAPVPGRTVVLAPGCKTGRMTAKRWGYFPELAERFDDVAVVGTADDLRQFDGGEMRFPAHCRSLVDRLGLRETAEFLAGAAVVVGNDSGLSHMAAAVSVPTLMLFGPTPHLSLGPLPQNARVLRMGLACEPCWFTTPLRACRSRIDCLRGLTVDDVEREARRLMGTVA